MNEKKIRKENVKKHSKPTTRTHEVSCVTLYTGSVTRSVSYTCTSCVYWHNCVCMVWRRNIIQRSARHSLPSRVVHISAQLTPAIERVAWAQRDGRPPLFHRRRTFVATCENLVTMATGVGQGRAWMIPLHCSTLKAPTFVQESGTYLLYALKPRYSQFYVQIANFS